MRTVLTMVILLSIYYMPDTVLSPGDTNVKVLVLKRLTFSLRGNKCNR